jgi:Tfp pilus assembly protein PilN
VRPVNLIPKDQQAGARAGIGGGRTGFGPYIALGVLGLAVIGVAVSVLTSNGVNSRKGKVAGLERETASVKAEADALRPYGGFAAVKQARVDTINALVDTSFNWERVVRSLSRTIPSNVWLTQFTGTVSPDVKFESGGGGGSSARSKTQSPAIELSGCTYSHSAVARMMVRMRNLDDVTEVVLQSSEKSDSVQQAPAEAPAPGTSGGGGSAGGDCRTKYNITKFELLVVFGHAKVKTSVSDIGAAPSPVAAAQGAAATASAPSSTGAGQ